MNGNALLTVAEMYEADRLAAALGVPSLELMEAAGEAVVREIRRRWRPRRTAVLCGPGNNGGDGFVVARLLQRRGWPVRVALLGARETLRGDAAVNAGRFQGPVRALDVSVLDGCELVVDALFGAGLTRDLEGSAREVVEAIGARGLDCVAVDIPSGVSGDTGAVLGVAPKAMATVTFFRLKPGHLLLPGRTLCGDCIVADIGIPDTVLEEIHPTLWLNGPPLWTDKLRWPRAGDHKYTRGHALVSGGTGMTGAARLAAIAARRIGAGMVTVAASPETVGIYAAGSPGTIVHTVMDDADFHALTADPRRNAILIGPGAGRSEGTRARVSSAMRMERAVVLDADALTVFEDDPETLFSSITSPCVLTPHEGEFARLFGLDGDKITRARAAARFARAVVLLKGSDSVIAAPDGRAAINANAPASLATAGSGDVLAGFVLGFLAQGLAPFDAACAATWCHGMAAQAVGAGLVAEDLVEAVPSVLAALKSSQF